MNNIFSNPDDCPADELQAEQTRLLYANLGTSLLANTLLIAILIAVQYAVIDFGRISVWLAMMGVVLMGRYALLRAWQRSGIQAADCTCWLRRFRIGAIATGMAWGVGALLLFPHGDIDHQTFLAFVLAGLSAGGVASLAVDRVSMLGFLMPMLLPLVLHFWQEGGGLALTMGMMVMLFLAFITLHALRARSSLHENIHLRLRAEEQERKLIDSEARLKQAQHTAHIGNWELDLVANRLYWSDEIYRIFEIDPAGFSPSYESFLNAIHPEDRNAVSLAYTRSLETKEPYEIIHRLRMVDGRVKWVSERCDTTFDAMGRPLRSVGTVQDITAHQLAENALRESEARFRAVTQSANDAIVTADGAGNIVGWNRGAEIVFGYNESEVVGQPLTMLMPSRFRAHHQAGMARMRTDGKSHAVGKGPLELIGLRKDGSEFPLEMSLSGWESPSGRYFTGIIRDVAERKQVEQEKNQLRYRQQALLDAIQESTFLIARDGTLLLVNEVGARRLGSSPMELAGKNIYDIFPPHIAAARRERFEQILRSGLPQTFEDQRDGRHFLSAIYPIRDAADEVSSFAVYAADVTQQRRSQAIEELFSSINQKVLQGVPLPELLHFICEEVARQFDLNLIWLGRKESDGTVTVMTHAGSAGDYIEHLSRIGVRWDDTPQGRGGTGMAIRSGQVQFLTPSYPGFRLWREIAQQYGFQSMMAIPLLIRGEVYGAFTLYSNQADAFHAALANLLVDIAARISVALETAMDQLQIRLLGSALAEAGNGVMITNVRGVIQWVNPAFIRMSGYSKDELIGRTPGILNSGQQDREYYQVMWETVGKGETWCSETVERAKDGSFYVVSQTITPILDEDGRITHFISIHEDITAQKKTQERIAYMAHYDALTGLPNRALFYDRLAHALTLSRRNRGGLALMFLDLDGFKQVNDTLGHQAGDQLLLQVAQRLHHCVRESDTVARLGGDEFTVILNGTHVQQDVSMIAEKIIAAMALPFSLEGKEARIGVSIGIARYSEDADSEDALVRKADQAMYEAKSAGKNTYRFGLPE